MSWLTRNRRFTSIHSALKVVFPCRNGKIPSLLEAVGVALELGGGRHQAEQTPRGSARRASCLVLMPRNTVLLKTEVGEGSL